MIFICYCALEGQKYSYLFSFYFLHNQIIMFVFIALLILFYILYRLYQHFFPTPNINPNGKYVLISGCDTGFGHRLAIELDKQGFNVLAGVFTANNITSLKNELSSNATVFRLDITKQEDIDATFELVKRKQIHFMHLLIMLVLVGWLY